MRAVLEFDLPEDQDEFELSTQEGRWRLVVEELDQWLRDIIKYREADFTPEKMEVFELCRSALHDRVVDGGLSLP
jgi:hypothetical protein